MAWLMFLLACGGNHAEAPVALVCDGLTVAATDVDRQLAQAITALERAPAPSGAQAEVTTACGLAARSVLGAGGSLRELEGRLQVLAAVDTSKPAWPTELGRVALEDLVVGLPCGQLDGDGLVAMVTEVEAARAVVRGQVALVEQRCP